MDQVVQAEVKRTFRCNRVYERAANQGEVPQQDPPCHVLGRREEEETHFFY